MEMVLDLTKVDRETALRAWLAYHEIGEKELALRIGASPSVITRIITGERSSKGVIERLVAVGIPAALLPPPGPGPGRPRKT